MIQYIDLVNNDTYLNESSKPYLNITNSSINNTNINDTIGYSIFSIVMMIFLGVCLLIFLVSIAVICRIEIKDECEKTNNNREN